MGDKKKKIGTMADGSNRGSVDAMSSQGDDDSQEDDDSDGSEEEEVVPSPRVRRPPQRLEDYVMS